MTWVRPANSEALSVAISILLSSRGGSQITRAKAEAWASEALAAGHSLGQEVKACYPGLGPVEVAHQVGVGIKFARDNRWLRAIYTPEPPTVTIYPESLEPLQDRLHHLRLPQGFSLLDLAIAHELFHHFEHVRGSISKRYYVNVFKLGRFSLKTSLPALSEIAAHAFTKELLGLDFYPYQLDDFE